MKVLILFLFFSLNYLFASNLNVTVSILPQKYFVEKIAKDRVNVNVMVMPGFSPHNYEPKTSQMKKLSTSKIYFANGVSFEKTWLKRFKSANKNITIVDISDGIKKIKIDSTHNHDHSHGHDDHSDETDPHTWLDPNLVKKQAFNIFITLSKFDEKNAKFYKENYNNFLVELESLDLELKKILNKHKNSSFMVFHPSWGYFAKAYGLNQIPVEVEGKEPKISKIIELVKEAKEENIKIVFTSPQFSKKSANVIASNIKGLVVEIDSLSYNYKENLIKTAKAINSALAL